MEACSQFHFDVDLTTGRPALRAARAACRAVLALQDTIQHREENINGVAVVVNRGEG